jgi:hypothetical protein
MWFHYNNTATNSNIVSVKINEKKNRYQNDNRPSFAQINTTLCKSVLFWRASQVLTTAVKLVSMENGTDLWPIRLK